MDKFSFRLINNDDFHKGYLQLLKQLTDTDEITEDKFKELLNTIKNNNTNIFVFEDLEEKKIIGSATLLIEQKIIHGGGKVAHLEDVVIDESYRGINLGKKLIENVVKIAKESGCYKIIGDCKEYLVKFYEKNGFQNKGVQIAIYF